MVGDRRGVGVLEGDGRTLSMKSMPVTNEDPRKCFGDEARDLDGKRRGVGDLGRSAVKSSSSEGPPKHFGDEGGDFVGVRGDVDLGGDGTVRPMI